MQQQIQRHIGELQYATLDLEVCRCATCCPGVHWGGFDNMQQHRIEKMFHDSSGRIQAKLLELHCMGALNNGSRRTQNSMASKTAEAEGEKRFNHYDDNRGIISGGEGTRGETSAPDVVNDRRTRISLQH